MKLKLSLLVLVLALQTAWILGTTFIQERTLAAGTVISLETRLVDPRDLLRGDYVTLNYKISDVAFGLFSPARTNQVPPGQTVYVALGPRGQFYEVVRASTEELAPAAGQVLLKGRSQSRWNSATAKTVRVLYGLESYYVREGTGNPRGKKLTVQAAVPASGQARIKQVFIDGKPYAEVMKGRAE